jgi:hypothetical protein
MGREGKMEPHFLYGMGFFYSCPPRVKRGERTQSIFCPPKNYAEDKANKTNVLKRFFAWHMDCCFPGRGEVFSAICQSPLVHWGEEMVTEKIIFP